MRGIDHTTLDGKLFFLILDIKYLVVYTRCRN